MCFFTKLKIVWYIIAYFFALIGIQSSHNLGLEHVDSKWCWLWFRFFSNFKNNFSTCHHVCNANDTDYYRQPDPDSKIQFSKKVSKAIGKHVHTFACIVQTKNITYLYRKHVKNAKPLYSKSEFIDLRSRWFHTSFCFTL